MTLRIHLHTPLGRVRTIDLAHRVRTSELVDLLMERVRVRDAKPHAAGVMCVDQTGAVLLLKRRADAESHPSEWAFPAGGIEPGETPEQAARREALEEMSVKLRTLKPLGTYVTPETHFTCFKAHTTRFSPHLCREHSAYAWVQTWNLPRPLHPGIKELVQGRSTTHDDAEDDSDGHWLTINGAHVFVDGKGNITKGPAELVGKHKSEFGKPATAKATTAKAAVHELLSSGHSFSFEELMKATGAKNPVSLSTAISDLKNPKYAGKLHIQILKDKNGHLYIGKPEVAAAAHAKADPAASPSPKPVAPASPGILAASPVVKAPSVKMSHEAATKVYEDKMADVFEQAGVMAAGPEATANADAAKYFKEEKAKAMAQFAANTKGVDQVPKKVEVFKADEDFAYELAKADFMKPSLKVDAQKKAYADWKAATAKAKHSTPAPSPAPTAPVEPKPKVTVVKADPEKPTTQLPAGGHQPHFPAVPNYVPSDHVGVTKEDFKAGVFQTGLSNGKSLFTKNSKSAGTNKANIQHALEKRLEASAAWQALSKSAKKKSYGSLAAELVSTWASTSGDSHPVAVAQQLSVRDAFDMDHEHLSAGNMSSLHTGKHQDDSVFAAAAESIGAPYSTAEQKATFRAGMRDFVLAQYHNTQDWLKDKGITHMYLARGHKEDMLKGKAETGHLKLQPVSSFSTQYSTAQGFASGGNVYFVKVPREQIMGSYLTGFGCTNEHEVVVLAHKDLQAVKLAAKHDTIPEAMGHVKESFGYGASKTVAAPTSAPVSHATSLNSTTPHAVTHPSGYVQAAPPTKPAATGTLAQAIQALAQNLDLKGLVDKEAKLAAVQSLPKIKAYLKEAKQYVVNQLESKALAEGKPKPYMAQGPKKVTGLPETTMKNGTVTTAKQAAWAGDLAKLKDMQKEHQYSYGVTGKGIKLYLNKLVIHLEKKGYTA